MDISIQHIDHYTPALLKELIKLNEGKHPPNRKFFTDKKNILLIAFYKQEIAGFLWAYLLIHPDRPRPAFFLYSIDVFEPFRKRGIAAQLIRYLKQMARKQKCFEIFVFTEPSNAAAIKLYTKTGGIKEKLKDIMFVYPLK